MRRLGALIVGLTLASGGYAADAEKAKADQILERMAKVYAEAKSYRDTGMLKVVHVAKFKSTKFSPFETAFIRPDRYRLRYTYRNGEAEDEFFTYIAWLNGKDAKTWWSLQGLNDAVSPQSLPGSGAGAGPGGQLVYYIPTLLFHERLGVHLNKLKDPVRAEDDKLGKAECYRIRGEHLGMPTTLWIDRASFLVRKVSSVRELQGSRMELTILYDPEINGAIPEKALAFDPPK